MYNLWEKISLDDYVFRPYSAETEGRFIKYIVFHSGYISKDIFKDAPRVLYNTSYCVLRYDLYRQSCGRSRSVDAKHAFRNETNQQINARWK